MYDRNDRFSQNNRSGRTGGASQTRSRRDRFVRYDEDETEAPRMRRRERLHRSSSRPDVKRATKYALMMTAFFGALVYFGFMWNG